MTASSGSPPGGGGRGYDGKGGGRGYEREFRIDSRSWGNHRALVTQQKLNHGGARGCRSNLMQGRSIVVVIYV